MGKLNKHSVLMSLRFVVVPNESFSLSLSFCTLTFMNHAFLYFRIPYFSITRPLMVMSILKEFGHIGTICVCRRLVLEQQLASSQVPREEQLNLIKDLERKETEYMRLKRHRICVDDFEMLTIIGRGAFGEVCTFRHSYFCKHAHDFFSVILS